MDRLLRFSHLSPARQPRSPLPINQLRVHPRSRRYAIGNQSCLIPGLSSLVDIRLDAEEPIAPRADSRRLCSVCRRSAG